VVEPWGPVRGCGRRVCTRDVSEGTMFIVAISCFGERKVTASLSSLQRVEANGTSAEERRDEPSTPELMACVALTAQTKVDKKFGTEAPAWTGESTSIEAGRTSLRAGSNGLCSCRATRASAGAPA